MSPSKVRALALVVLEARRSPLEDRCRRRLVGSLCGKLCSHALDLLLKGHDACVELGHRKALEALTQSDALGGLGLQIVPVHDLLPVWSNGDSDLEPAARSHHGSATWCAGGWHRRPTGHLGFAP